MMLTRERARGAEIAGDSLGGGRGSGMSARDGADLWGEWDAPHRFNVDSGLLAWLSVNAWQGVVDKWDLPFPLSSLIK